VAPDTCPLCGTDVALLRRPTRRPAIERERARITTLRERAAAVRAGALTPRRLKDDALWMCAPCQRIMVGGSPLDRQEIQRRIHDEVRRLERRAS
jgi:hypothetical protein